MLFYTTQGKNHKDQPNVNSAKSRNINFALKKTRRGYSKPSLSDGIRLKFSVKIKTPNASQRKPYVEVALYTLKEKNNKGNNFFFSLNSTSFFFHLKKIHFASHITVARSIFVSWLLY